MGGLFVASMFVTRLNREWRVRTLMDRAGSGGPVVAGAAFAIAWTPCVGPTLAAILSAAALTHSAASGAYLLAFYSAGLAIPFLITALAFSRATTAFAFVKRHYSAIIATGGVILIGMGILVLTGELQRAPAGVGLEEAAEVRLQRVAASQRQGAGQTGHLPGELRNVREYRQTLRFRSWPGRPATTPPAPQGCRAGGPVVVRLLGRGKSGMERAHASRRAPACHAKTSRNGSCQPGTTSAPPSSSSSVSTLMSVRER
jgi:hypothetical protein